VSLVCFVLFCLTPGVGERELAGLRTALLEFASDVFAGFARADQRATGLRYLCGSLERILRSAHTYWISAVDVTRP
jgi:hypothetical protein